MAPQKAEIEKICESAGAPLPLRDGHFAYTLMALGLTTALQLVSCHAELGQETPTAAAMTYLCTLIWTTMNEINANGGVDNVPIDLCPDPNAGDAGRSDVDKQKVNDFLSACRWLQVCHRTRARSGLGRVRAD